MGGQGEDTAFEQLVEKKPDLRGKRGKGAEAGTAKSEGMGWLEQGQAVTEKKGESGGHGGRGG